MWQWGIVMDNFQCFQVGDVLVIDFGVILFILVFEVFNLFVWCLQGIMRGGEGQSGEDWLFFWCCFNLVVYLVGVGFVGVKIIWQGDVFVVVGVVGVEGFNGFQWYCVVKVVGVVVYKGEGVIKVVIFWCGVGNKIEVLFIGYQGVIFCVFKVFGYGGDVVGQLQFVVFFVNGVVVLLYVVYFSLLVIVVGEQY